MRIDDARFLAQLSRRFLARPSRYLTGCSIDVIHYGSEAAGLEVRIGNGISVVLSIAWVRQQAFLLPGSRLLSAADLDGLDEAFTDLVRRLLFKHHLIDINGQSTQKGVA
jgi:hypothetical protein